MKPKIAVTMGDPSGIGPEIVALAMTSDKIYKVARPVVIGSKNLIYNFVKSYDLDVEVNSYKNDKNLFFSPNIINVIEPYDLHPDQVVAGKIQKISGAASYKFIAKATELILSGELDAMATAPIHKEALKLAGIPQAGCTEILGDLTDTGEPLTMFEVDNLRIFFHSRHVSLKESIELVRKDRLIYMIRRSVKALEKIGVKHETFAVAGLNPHCSDGGLFGNEEAQEIIPAVKALQKEGYNILGPIGADSVFHLAKENNWDGVLSLYHDQGHIASKTLDFYGTVSVTLDLPFIRSSVDHGTAFDIAGQKKANPASMEQAILTAANYARYYNQ